MMNYSHFSAQPEYDTQFWNMARGNVTQDNYLSRGYNTADGTYRMPLAANNKVEQALAKESLFRNISTVINAHAHGYRIFVKDCDDMALFVPEGGQIPIYDGLDDFTTKTVDHNKLAVFVKMDTDFASDASFDIDDYLSKRIGRNFARGEDNSFINGTGEKDPTGILHESDGADVGVTAESLTYDEVINLYFSVKAEYRKNGVWLMNDETALVLRKLKDSDCNYLWNHANDTILGKPVMISEFMPGIASGKKPIAFGDFSYYWIISRSPVFFRALFEKFALNNQIGYLSTEYLDAKLVRKDAIKVIQMA